MSKFVTFTSIMNENKISILASRIICVKEFDKAYTSIEVDGDSYDVLEPFDKVMEEIEKALADRFIVKSDGSSFWSSPYKEGEH